MYSDYRRVVCRLSIASVQQVSSHGLELRAAVMAKTPEVKLAVFGRAGVGKSVYVVPVGLSMTSAF
ncbi:hypothetical protein F7725_021527 [Dissostichus mawsoni]|uniref:Uncharacterized protein n=1 Tax=Dissostichus mawsoni TaxID=36200 RepID=A0A7J5ZFI4_DISMA|nr:hypothetical protein F7725_021527 [Dissostichus mawsoni]